MKTCYYELLGVERDVNDKDLKKAYFKMSLKYHPDKNKEEDAREKFQLINEAYECLSDPNERTWYDNHRTQILSGKTDLQEEDLLEASFGGIDPNKYTNSGCYEGFGEGKKGFYAVYRDFFEKIKAQELKAYERGEAQGDFYAYPGFGDANTDPYVVNEFYVKWDNFITYKNFSWADQYRDDGEGRFVKRIIERENNKFRKKEKKNYLDLLKKIVDFCCKKDPRQEEFVRLEEEERLRKKKYREQQQLDKERQKKEMRHQQRLIEQQRLQEEEELIRKGLKVVEGYEAFDHIKEQEEELRDFYCQVCDKEYKNDKALENHKNSKQHKKNMKLLLEQVGTQEEIEELQHQSQKQEEQMPEEEEEMVQKSKKNKKNKKKNKQFMQQAQQFQTHFEEVPEVPEFPSINQNPTQNEESTQNKDSKQNKEESPDEKTPQRKKSSMGSEDDDAFFKMMNQKIQKKNTKKKNPMPTTKIPQQQEELIKEPIQEIIQEKIPQPQNKEEKNDQQKQKNKGDKIELAKSGDIDISELSKAKQKKLKKQQQEEQEKDSKFKCNVCKAGFPSKTKMFDHCKKEGHLRAQ